MIYAIDYGTSNSLLCAASDKGVTAPIALDSEAADPTILRSVLYFPHMNEVHYGSSAIREFVARDMQGRFIRSIKKYLPIKSFVGTFVDDRPINLEDVIGLFLGEMRKRANAHFKQDVDSVVLGRPARFSNDKEADDFAQYRLERAARQAGFKHIEFCPEPVAAAYEFRKTITSPKTVLVADYGGGTSDYTVIRISPDEFSERDVLAIGGVSIAGDALDGAFMRRRISPYFGADVTYKVPFGSNVLKMPVSLIDKICSPADVVLLRGRDTLEFFRNVRTWSLGKNDKAKMDRLFALIEDQLGFDVFERIDQVKRTLSSEQKTAFEFSYPSLEKIRDEVTRAQFEEVIQSQVEQILTSLDDTVAAAGLKHSDIDIVCCTGGTSKVPALHQALALRFGAEKLTSHGFFHAVVQGLAEKALTLV